MERKPSRFEVRLPPDLEEQIDHWRRHQADLPPRAEAARRLILAGLAPRETLVPSKAPVAAPDRAEESLAVPAGKGRQGMPWHDPKVRPDTLKTLNTKIPESLFLQIAWLSHATTTSKQEIIATALREYLTRELGRMGISP